MERTFASLPVLLLSAGFWSGVVVTILLSNYIHLRMVAWLATILGYLAVYVSFRSGYIVGRAHGSAQLERIVTQMEQSRRCLQCDAILSPANLGALCSTCANEKLK